MSASTSVTPASFTETFTELRALLTPYAPRLYVAEDRDGAYVLFVCAADGKKPPVYFAAVGVRKGYVSFHLPPVYCHPELLDDVPNLLRARMQGKSCFNFKRVDTERFTELAALIGHAFTQYQEDGLILPAG